jgi:hypothetical protein
MSLCPFSWILSIKFNPDPKYGVLSKSIDGIPGTILNPGRSDEDIFFIAKR